MKMNKLDKQLIEAINEWLLNLTDGYFQLSKYSMGDDDTTWNAFEKIKEATLEANKQSILKAIEEEINKMEKDIHDRRTYSSVIREVLK